MVVAACGLLLTSFCANAEYLGTNKDNINTNGTDVAKWALRLKTIFNSKPLLSFTVQIITY